MKTLKKNALARNIFVGFFTLTILFSFGSCARKVSFLTSSVVPAARGYIKVKRDSNKNYVIQVHLSDLAEVGRLQPPRQTYVVWMVTDREETKNIGQVKSSENLVSKNLSASFETVSSSRPTKIFITAEDDPGSQYPGTLVVLSTDKFWN